MGLFYKNIRNSLGDKTLGIKKLDPLIENGDPGQEAKSLSKYISDLLVLLILECACVLYCLNHIVHHDHVKLACKLWLSAEVPECRGSLDEYIQ